jgi:FkbM family methyltransferase
MSTRATAESVLCRARLYRPARNGYQRMFNRRYMQYRRQGRAFYMQFIERGDLVFDAGANRGLMSEMFLELGARVVALEPIPHLAGLISRRYGHGRLAVHACAVGDLAGEATLHVGRDDAHSSISDDWVQLVRATPGLPERWGRTITVPVRTFDEMIDRYGLPAFIKIDIEGHEPAALNGLSQPVRALSFEFQCAAPDRTRQCLDRLASLGDYRYRMAAGEQLRYMDLAWCDSGELMDRLAELATADPVTHGDVYARLA